MPIRTDRAVAHGVEQRFAVALIGLSIEFAGDVQIIPANDGVLVAAPSCAHDYSPRLGIRMRQRSRIKDYQPQNGSGQRRLGWFGQKSFWDKWKDLLID